MKDEYDFSNVEKGKFYRPKGELKIPVYLAEDVRLYLQGKKRDADLSSIATSQRNKFVSKVLR
jgi:hypothetical protein